MPLELAFVLPYGEHADVFFPDTLLAELSARAREDGHRSSLVRVYYDGSDAGVDLGTSHRLIEWLESKKADVVIFDRLFDSFPLVEYLSRKRGRTSIFVSRGDSFDTLDGIDWVVGAFAGVTRSGKTRRSPTIPELVQAFRETIAALDSGGDPSEVPGVGRLNNGVLESRFPIRQAATQRPYNADVEFEIICSKPPPDIVRKTLFGNSGCPYSADLDKSHLLVGLNLPDKPMSRLGCSFCCMGGDYEKQPDSMVVETVAEQALFWSRYTPLLKEFVLSDQSPLRYLAALIRSYVKQGGKPVRWLFAARADSFVREKKSLEEAILAARDSGHVVEVYLSGFESFSDAELERYNKGLTSQELLKAVGVMRETKARYPSVFDYNKSRGHSLILFSPWTTPEDLRQSLTTVRSHGLLELFDEIGRNRLRLYEDLPLFWAAERDGALTSEWEDGDLGGAARRKGYNTERPWKFLDPRTRVIWSLSGELRRRLGSTTELSQLFSAVDYAESAGYVGANAVDSVLGRLEELQALLRSLAIGGEHGTLKRGSSTRAVPVYFTGSCNNGCRDCQNKSVWREDSYDAIGIQIEKAVQLDKPIVFVGREPSIHPDFLRLLAKASGRGRRKVGVVSNGRLFSISRIALAARSQGLFSASIKVFAAEESLADRIAQAQGGFGQASKAFIELKKAGVQGREMLIPLHSLNLENLEQYAVLARSLHATQLRLEVALESLGLENLGDAVAAIQRLKEKCVTMGIPLNSNTLEAGVNRFDRIPT